MSLMLDLTLAVLSLLPLLLPAGAPVWGLTLLAALLTLLVGRIRR